MKLTWFGGRTLRIYAGGEIIVIHPDSAPTTIDRNELLSAADRLIDPNQDSIPRIDPAEWRPRPAARLIDGPRSTEIVRIADSTLLISAARLIDGPRSTEIVRIADSTLLISAAGEPPLVLLGEGDSPRFGRWADGAVMILMSARESLVAEATVLLDVARPRLIVLALDEQTLDTVVGELGEHLQGVGLVSLEPGLALEV